MSSSCFSFPLISIGDFRALRPPGRICDGQDHGFLPGTSSSGVMRVEMSSSSGSVRPRHLRRVEGVGPGRVLGGAHDQIGRRGTRLRSRSSLPASELTCQGPAYPLCLYRGLAGVVKMDLLSG